jgi:hypothetical protein
MYRDIPELKILQVEGDPEANTLFKPGDLKIGHEHFFALMRQHNCKFDEAFYIQMNIPFDKRWSSFYFERDYEKEDILFQHYGVDKTEEYQFIHDDPKRGFAIKPEHLTEMKEIRPVMDKTDNILHYAGILENASVIHCIDSSFKCFTETLNLKAKNLFFHSYARSTEFVPTSRLGWRSF